MGSGRSTAIEPFGDDYFQSACIVTTSVIRTSLQLNVMRDWSKSVKNGSYAHRCTIASCVLSSGRLLFEAWYKCIEQFHGRVTLFTADINTSVTYKSHMQRGLRHDGVLFLLLFGLVFWHTDKVFNSIDLWDHDKDPQFFVSHVLAESEKPSCPPELAPWPHI